MEKLVLLAVLLPVVACVADSKQIGETVSGSAGSGTAGSETGAESGLASGTGAEAGTSLSGTGMVDTGGDPTGTSGAHDTGVGDTTGGAPQTCEQAETPAECATVDNAPPDRGTDCGWYELATWVVGGDGTCTDIDMPAGYCFTTAQGDDGCGLEFIDSTCPDGQTIVYFNPVGLEIGAVEIFAEDLANPTCDGPRGSFLPCEYDGETFTPPECACGCPG